MSNVKTNPIEALLASISDIGKEDTQLKKETEEALKKLERCDKECIELFADAFGVDETEKE